METRAIELLEKELNNKSLEEIGCELQLSKTTLSLVVNKKYAKPKKIYQKILDKYDKQIVGNDVYQSYKGTNIEISKQILKEYESV